MKTETLKELVQLQIENSKDDEKLIKSVGRIIDLYEEDNRIDLALWSEALKRSPVRLANDPEVTQSEPKKPLYAIVETPTQAQNLFVGNLPGISIPVKPLPQDKETQKTMEFLKSHTNFPVKEEEPIKEPKTGRQKISEFDKQLIINAFEKGDKKYGAYAKVAEETRIRISTVTRVLNKYKKSQK
jgi:hypothetical protein